MQNIDAIEIYKITRMTISDNKKKIESRIEKIKNKISDSVRVGKFNVLYGLEEHFSEDVAEYFRDSGFDVTYNVKDQSLKVSWDFRSYPVNYFINLEKMPQYDKLLKRIDANGEEFSDIIMSIDPLITRYIIKETRSLLKGKTTSFELIEIIGDEYFNIKKMLEMMGLKVSDKKITYGGDYNTFDSEVYIGAN